MKLQPLYDLQQEINRLYVAGSKLSAGDPRIQKHIATFSKLGEKAPVFAKISKDLEELIQVDKEYSAEKLISVSILLYSVLYTQGETFEEDQVIAEQKPVFDVKDLETNISYLEIKPVIEALTTTGSGRLEVIQEALTRGLMKDSRLYHYIDMGLNDKYAELADYMETKVIPAIGVGMMSTVLKNFKHEDTKEQERRFRVLKQLGYEGMDALADEILKGSNSKLQVEAIEYLGGDVKNEALLISMMNEKSVAKAKAVYTALVNLGTDTALEALVDAYLENKNKSRVEAFTTALSLSSLPRRFDEVFEKAKQSFVALKAVDTSSEEAIKAADIQSFSHMLASLEKSKRNEVLPFFSEVLAEKKLNQIINKKNYYSYQNPIYDPIQNALWYFPITTQIDFYKNQIAIDKDTALLRKYWTQYFYASVKNGISKQDLYDTFHQSYSQGYLHPYEVINVFYRFDYRSYYKLDSVLLDTHSIDARWADLFMQQISGKWKDDYESLLYFLVTYKGAEPKLQDLLIDYLKNAKVSDAKYGIFYSCLLHIAKEPLIKFMVQKLADDIVDANISYFRSYYNMWPAVERLPKEYTSYFASLASQHEGKPFASLLGEIANRINH